eukprot:607078-Rhodomonas_salina.1
MLRLCNQTHQQHCQCWYKSDWLVRWFLAAVAPYMVERAEGCHASPEHSSGPPRIATLTGTACKPDSLRLRVNSYACQPPRSHSRARLLCPPLHPSAHLPP